MNKISKLIKVIVPYIFYPLVLCICFSFHVVFIKFNYPLTLATWLAVLFGLVSIIMLEKKVPYRAEWQPKKNDWIVDLFYMAIVQVLLVKLMTFIAISILLNFL